MKQRQNARTLIKPSTRAFRQEARRTPGYSLFDWLHGYVYARWPYLYIGIGAGTHPLGRLLGPLARGIGRLFPPPADDSQQGTIADGYHGKVVPLEAAAQLVTVQEDVDLGDLEQTIPYPVARDIVLKNPDHIVVLECPCRSVRPNPCLPLDVCLIVGEPFASFVIEHHPQRSRWISQGEAVDILRAEQERGHVSHAFFKDAMLNRFYAICNCCSCCCGAMHAHQNGTPMLASSGYVAHVDVELCAACGSCADSCQFAAISVDDGFARIDPAACMGCGVCVAHCPQEALSLVRDPAKGEPLEIQTLIAQAAQLT
ncbi:MAG TPA: 4Fe-4S binding protein [Anaerolineae bacterium]|nr:4Fe-4S binding protein [Anaerolineae bacterium]